MLLQPTIHSAGATAPLNNHCSCLPGAALGNGVALVAGGVFYEKLGIRTAYATQVVPNALVLLMLPPVFLWRMQPWTTSTTSSKPAPAGNAQKYADDADASVKEGQHCQQDSTIHELAGQQQQTILALPMARQGSFLAASVRSARTGSSSSTRGLSGELDLAIDWAGSQQWPPIVLPLGASRLGSQPSLPQAGDTRQHSLEIVSSQHHQKEAGVADGEGSAPAAGVVHCPASAICSSRSPEDAATLRKAALARAAASTAATAAMLVAAPEAPASSLQPVAAAAAAVAQDKAAASPQQAAPAAAGQPPSALQAVWNVLRCWPLLAECILIFVCQVSRTAMDILMSLLLLDSPTTVVSIVFAVETIGSVALPFIVDNAVNDRGWDSRGTCVGVMLVMAVACAMTLLPGYAPLCSHVPGLCPSNPDGSVWQNVPWTMVVVMAVFAACQSAAEPLIFGNMVHSLAAQGDPVRLPTAVASNVFALFHMAGTTVGSYIAGAPAVGVFWQQELVAGLLAAVAVVATLGINVPFMIKASNAAVPAAAEVPVGAKGSRL